MKGALQRILTVSLLGGALGLAIAPAPAQLPGITQTLLTGAGGIPACSITGGTTSLVNGQTAYHFTVNGTITCPTARTMYYLVVGGGGGGACGLVPSYSGGAGGGAGGGVITGLMTFPSGLQNVSIGAGGGGCPTTGVGIGAGINGGPTGIYPTTCTLNNQGGGTDSNVIGLWHFDNNGNDGSGRGFNGALTGSATFSNAQSKFGGYSLYANLGGMAVGVLPSLGTGAFTMEGWIYWPSVPNTIQDFTGSDSVATFEAGSVGNPTSRFWTSGVNNNWTFTFAAGQWYHYAWVRDGSGNINFYVNGTLATTVSGMTASIGSTTAWSIGSRAGNSQPMNGYIDEMRISNMARYTANFTPQTTPFCDASNATLRAEGGGAGVGYAPSSQGNQGIAGASGGGNGGTSTTTTASNGGPNISGQGFMGGLGQGAAPNYPGGGGGGAGGTGGNATTSVGGSGGPGLQSAISGSLVSYGCGAGGSTYNGGTAGAPGCASAGLSQIGNSPGTAATGQGSGGGAGGGASGPSGGMGGAGAAGEVWLVEATPPGMACAITGAGNLVGQVNTNVVYQFTTNGTLTCPSARQINYVLVAGGGAGGNVGASGLGFASGAGGGAGGVKAGAFQIGTSAYTVTIGAGGIPVASNTTTFGGNGGNSSFGSLPPAIGGGGGAAGVNNGTGFGQSGGSQGGTSRATAPTSGWTVGQGNQGGSGYTSTGYRSGGGGGPGGPGVTGTSTVAGTGGLGYFLGSNFYGNICIAGGGGGGTEGLTGSTSGLEGQGVCGGGRGTLSNTDGPGQAAAAPGAGGGGAGTATNIQTAVNIGGAGAPGALYVSHPLTPSTTNVCVANTQGGGTDSNVSGLWHFDQLTADNGNGAHNGVLTGTASIAAAPPTPKFSGALLGAISSAMNIGHTPGLQWTGDFTYEWWAYFNSTSANYGYMGDASITFNIIQNGVAGTQNFYTPASGYLAFPYTVVSAAWHHWAFVRSGSTITLYIDGTSVGTGTASATIGNLSADIALANMSLPGNSQLFLPGYMDEARLSNLARYTANFTPQTLPFCDPSNAEPQWHTIYSQSAAQGGSAWTNYNIRDNISTLAYAGAQNSTQLRITFGANSGGPYTLTSAYVGHAATDGTRILDFTGDQVQAKFGGSTSAQTIPSGGVLVSDAIPYNFNASHDLVISMNWGSSGLASLCASCPNVSQNSIAGGGSQAGNTSSGGLIGTASQLYNIGKVEAFW
jgi:hypothetical protein